MNALFNKIKSTKTPFVIAEIGVNYYDIAKERSISPFEAALLMVDAAHESGSDAVKFQSYKADTLAVKASPAYWDTTKETSRNQHELFSRYDSFGAEEYRKIADHCMKRGVVFLSTPFDFTAADYLNKLCPLFKISSSDLSNWPFLEHIAKKKKPILLSTGASTMKEIKDAVKVLHKNGSREIGLLHCVLSYPTKYEDAHLDMMTDLAKNFPDVIIGYSDHTLPDPTMTCLTAAFLKGAKVIEKHFTLNKSLPGNDHYHAMDPDDLKIFKSNAALIAMISGSTKKRCLPCEKGARLHARRSIVTARDVRRGERLKETMLSYKRPAHGISPKDLNQLLGKTAQKDIPADTIIKWSMVK